MPTTVRLLTILTLLVPGLLSRTLAGASDEGTGAQNKALVVLIFDQTCKKWCEEVRPVVQQLKVQYGDQVTFAELDATESLKEETKKKAKVLGVEKYFADAADYVPMVQVFTAQRAMVKELVGPKTKEAYQNVIEKVLQHK